MLRTDSLYKTSGCQANRAYRLLVEKIFEKGQPAPEGPETSHEGFSKKRR